MFEWVEGGGGREEGNDTALDSVFMRCQQSSDKVPCRLAVVNTLLWEIYLKQKLFISSLDIKDHMICCLGFFLHFSLAAECELL